MVMLAMVMLAVVMCACIALTHGYSSPLSRTSNKLFMATGLHGEKFKFMPIFKGSKEDHFPRIVQIAGVFPGLSPEDVMAPSSSPAADPGTWMYSFPDPSDPNVGVVAVPGSDVITYSADPVAIISKSSVLGISGPDSECVLIIDRGDIDFYEGDFYAFQTFDNTVQVGWADSMDDFNAVIGRVVTCMMPTNEEDLGSSGFLEDE
jgi:hypothetical protein